MRIVFMGTPAFAVPSLEAIHKAHQVIAVYTQPPRPAGRGYDIQKSAVHDCADKLGIPVLTPKTLRDETAQQHFAALNAGIAVVAAYGLILPKAVLDTPKHGCINIHASLLPRWRGASPIQHAIWQGDTQSGVTIMQMEEGLDTGPMLLKGTTPITTETTTPMLHDTLSAMGSTLVLQALSTIDQWQPEKQNDADSSYAPMLKKQMGKIDWSQGAIEIARQIHALNPWPGTYTSANGKRLKILAATPTAGSGTPGKILNRAGHIACGKDALQLTSVQPDGSKPMDINAAINGHYLTIGENLS